MTIRPAGPDDLPAIVELYNHYVVNTPVNFDVAPFTVETRRPWFDKFGISGRYRLFVSLEEGRLTGYAGSMRYREKAAYDTSAEVTCYVAPDRQRQGIARRLYQTLFQSLRGEDLHRLLAGVTLPNDASTRFHESMGFRRIGIFTEQGRKLGRYWDVAWMERSFP